MRKIVMKRSGFARGFHLVDFFFFRSFETVYINLSPPFASLWTTNKFAFFIIRNYGIPLS